MTTLTKIVTVDLEAKGKPRMTQQDKWKVRDCVGAYRAYADEMRLKIGRVPDNIVGLSWVAYFSMPESWSAAKKAEMAGEIHQQKPDRDNVDKGILDINFKDDSGVAYGSMAKLWDDGQGPRIIITFYYRDIPKQPAKGREYVLTIKARGNLKPATKTTP